MRLIRVVSSLSLLVLLPSLEASAKEHKTRSHSGETKAAKPAVAATPITLKDGRLARIENGRVMLAQSGGNYVAAPAGRYTTREGKPLLIGTDGRLINSTSLNAEAPPQPEVKRKAPTSNGQYHQTGSHL